MAESINGNKDEIQLVEKFILTYPRSKITPSSSLTWILRVVEKDLQGNFNKMSITVNQSLNVKAEIRSKAINGRTYVKLPDGQRQMVNRFWR